MDSVKPHCKTWTLPTALQGIIVILLNNHIFPTLIGFLTFLTFCPVFHFGRKRRQLYTAVTKPGSVGGRQTQADTPSWTSTVQLDVYYRTRQPLLIMSRIQLFACHEISLCSLMH